MTHEEIDGYADLMYLSCKLNKSIESAKEGYKVVAGIVASTFNGGQITSTQIHLKAVFEENVREMIVMCGVIWELIMLEDDNFCKGIYSTENLHYQKLKSEGVNVIFIQNITSFEELDKHFKELFRSQLTGHFEFCYSPWPESNFNEAFSGGNFKIHRDTAKNPFSNGCVPFGLVFHLEEFAHVSWISDTWIRVRSFELGELKNAARLKNAACKEERQELFKKVATKYISLFSKEENDKLLIGIYNDVELHPYLSWQSASCLICSVKVKLQKCDLCKVACYCGGDHQKNHWKTHKKHCHKLVALRHDNNNNNHNVSQ
jgi:hypothetical protein